MVHITLWDIAVFLAFYALVYAGPVLLGLAVLLLALPASRRRRGMCWTAYGFMAIDLGLLVLSAPMLASTLDDYRTARAFAARTHHLAAAQAYGGITFPAGSTVHVGEDGAPEFGTLSAPTSMLGLVLEGEFRLGAEYGTEPMGVLDGTLAEPATIHGIPCGPGPLKSQGDTTRCTLERDWVFTGHVLAAGTALEVYRSPQDEPPRLTFGSLARPELLYDVTWPPSTIMGGVSQTPAQMAHGPEPDSQLVELCLPSGVVATVPGATLHGFLSYSVQEGGRRLVSPVCSILPEARVGDDGYAQVGPDRYSWGERPDARAPWQWTERFEPDPP